MSEALAKFDEEQELMKEVSTVERMALAVEITDEESYQKATDILKEIKSFSKKVTDYWEPMRKAAYDAKKAVDDHKKAMLDPLTKGEKIMKGKISDYLAAVERVRKEQEEELRRLAAAEQERIKAEAMKAEAEGDFDKTLMLLAQANAMGSAAAGGIVQADVKVEGVSQRADWEIVNIDQEKVPVEFNGVMFRPVDEKAVLAYIRSAKGKVDIPGVEYRQKNIISVRSK